MRKRGWSKNVEETVKETEWLFDLMVCPPAGDVDDNDNIKSVYSSSRSDSSIDEFDHNEKDDECLTDMQGRRILLVERLTDEMRLQMCCKQCALLDHEMIASEFLLFSDGYKEKVRKGEYDPF